ncbi:hypothetical protein [Acinetobacter kyonggiensis]|jgi:hypothetical protein|uniref:Uncharacterized protein n=1 Tax=Acinetobacter kyonggiensis TaxID=595670 RepID=A0A1H3G962_9GAMM|nr:hypothetical protein [Acinetobacter kyonggiensis]SDX99168.1 hypothetical protein SAMN05421643_10247 [Acinetobacter kyonggiensis]
MAQRKKETSFYPWVDVKDHSKGFKMNFSTVIYLELGRTTEGYKQAEFIGLKNPALALDYAYPEHFFLSSEGLILHKTASGKFEVIAKTDKC